MSGAAGALSITCTCTWSSHPNTAAAYLMARCYGGARRSCGTCARTPARSCRSSTASVTMCTFSCTTRRLLPSPRWPTASRASPPAIAAGVHGQDQPRDYARALLVTVVLRRIMRWSALGSLKGVHRESATSGIAIPPGPQGPGGMAIRTLKLLRSALVALLRGES